MKFYILRNYLRVKADYKMPFGALLTSLGNAPFLWAKQISIVNNLTILKTRE